MMYPRLRLAANLLRDDGVIFISIDDNEVTNLRKVCDEVFGEENFIGMFTWQSKKNSRPRRYLPCSSSRSNGSASIKIRLKKPPETTDFP